MRSRSAFGLAALFATSIASSAFAQQPQPAPSGQPAQPAPFQIPGLPPITLPGLTPPAQPAPAPTTQQQPQQQPSSSPPGVLPGILGPMPNQPAQPTPYGQPQPYGQQPGQYQQPNYGQQGQYGQPNYGNPGAPAPYTPYAAKKKRNRSTPLEIGYLYAVGTGYGVGMGIWIDAEANIKDPGLRFVPPLLTGAAAPAGIYLLDSPPMPKGLPSAIATGMLIGGAEGLGITTYQSVSSLPGEEWSFRGFARAEMIGSTLGGASGFAYWYLARPKPQHNMFYASAAVWGTVIGSQFGLGASNNSWSYGPEPYTSVNGTMLRAPDSCPKATDANPITMATPGCENGANAATARGGLIGMNVFLAGALAAGHAWNPSWNQIGWMWGGLAIGEAVTLPVYLFYAGSKADPRRGLIVQGIGGTLGVIGGALIGRPEHRGAVAELDEELQEQKYWETDKHKFRITGAGLMPVESGMGLSASGQIW